MAITNRNLPAGTTLTATYKKQAYTCIVLTSEDGTAGYTLEGDNRVFSSLSAAGSAVMGGVACNGWRFWSLVGAEPPASPGPALTRRPGRKAAVEGLERVIRRVPNQQGAPEGQVRWFCSGCMASFFADSGSAPDACPKGHAAMARNEFNAAD